MTLMILIAVVLVGVQIHPSIDIEERYEYLLGYHIDRFGGGQFLSFCMYKFIECVV
jgi:hypothetical protein